MDPHAPGWLAATPEGDGAVVVDHPHRHRLPLLELSVGDEVAPGDVVCVLEAMKLENDVTADAGGTVTDVPVAEGDSVDMGDALLALE